MCDLPPASSLRFYVNSCQFFRLRWWLCHWDDYVSSFAYENWRKTAFSFHMNVVLYCNVMVPSHYLSLMSPRAEVASSPFSISSVVKCHRGTRNVYFTSMLLQVSRVQEHKQGPARYHVLVLLPVIPNSRVYLFKL